MAVSDSELVQAWMTVLQLSRLQPGQVVTVLTSDASHPQTTATAIIAASLMGARVSRLHLPPVNARLSLSRDPLAYLGTTPLTGNRAAIAALKASDLVLDLMTLLFSPEQHEILSAGTRILLAVEPPEVLVRLLPSEADKARVDAAAALLVGKRQMRVSSAAGTDFRAALGEFPVIKEYGFVDEPGRWDHWPSGFLFTWPDERSAQGVIVIDRGDILLPQKSYAADSIALTVTDGYVTAVEGGVDAELLRDYVESFADPEAYAISHIGWGLQTRARWSTLALYDREATLAMDARAYAGNFLFSLGPNNEAGGQRDTACHLDIPLRRCTVSVDGIEVVSAGRLVEPLPAGRH